jgi:hypothetical protein
MLKQVIPKSNKFLDMYAHPNSKYKTIVLVHCAAGVSRSTTVLLAWMMKTYKLSLNKALKIVRDRRPIVNPNHGFLRVLQEYERFLQRYHSTRFSMSDLKSKTQSIEAFDGGSRQFAGIDFLRPPPRADLNHSSMIDYETPNSYRSDVDREWDDSRFLV